MTPSAEQNQIHFFDYFRVVSVRWPVIALIFLLVLITTGVITFLLPKQYESRALIQVQENTNLEIFQQGQAGRGWDPRFTSTQFEIIQSREILEPVIKKLGLDTKWAEEYELKSKALVLKKLERMMSLREERNTDLISISVLSPDQQEAADIANAIAQQYQTARIEEQRDWVGKSLSTLQEEVEKQRRKTDTLRKAATAIREEFQITDLNPESEMDLLQAPEQVLMSVEQQVSDQRLAAASLSAQYSQLGKLTDDQILRSVVTLGIEDSTVMEVLPRYQEAASEEAKLLSSGLGANHPNVQAASAKKNTYWEQLNSQITSLRAALGAKLEIEQESLKNLEEKLAESRADQQTSKSISATYYEAKTKYIQAKKVLESAEIKLWTEMMQRSMPMNPAIIWEKATPAEFPSRPRIFLNMALGVFFGLVLGFGVAFFIEYLDTSVKTMEDIERYFGLPVLAVIPKKIGVLMDLPPDTVDAEPYRILRTNIEFNKKDPTAKILTLVSGGPGEGKSTTLVNLAFAFAQSGARTLIIDADLRRPRQHEIFKVSNKLGLTDYLSKGAPIEDLIQPTKVDGLFLIPSGRLPHGAIAMLNSRRMAECLQEVKERFDMVLVDAPPILGVSDSSLIVRAVDMTALVIQHRRFPRAMLIRVKTAVLNAGGHLLGAVLNNVDVRLDQYYQYQTNYYGYYHKPTQEESREAERKPAKPVKELVSVSRESRGGGSRDEY